MGLATWWQGDAIPHIDTLADLSVAQSKDAVELAKLTELDPREVQHRLDGHHRAYVAHLHGTPVAYGWVATSGASIGELGLSFVLAAGDRYLWDFKTLPAWRGRGIYPRLLQAILRQEAHDAERFWIIHAPENGSSEAGIRKAGFQFVGELSFHRHGGVGQRPLEQAERARIGAALLGATFIERQTTSGPTRLELAPCWCCVIDAQRQERPASEVACWPSTPSARTAAPSCTCIPS